MKIQIPIFEDDKTISVLPSAKVKKIDKEGVHGWTNFYASFSERFATHALTALEVKNSDLVLDPFVGSGTLLVAALKLGIPAVGVDLDPFACLLSRAKVAVNADKTKVLGLLKKTSRKTYLSGFSDEAREIFRAECLCYASTVINRVTRATGTSSETCFKLLLSDNKGIYDSEVVALAAVCISASNVANLARGSNPTWYRKKIQGEKRPVEKLVSSSIATVLSMIADLDVLREEVLSRDIYLINGDFTQLDLDFNGRKVNRFVTSPPYLNRLDYIVKHLPNLLLLTGLIDIDFEKLRKRMIGTPKIVDKANFPAKWGSLCIDTLKKIQDHKSYASSSYYIWTYSQYFGATFQSLEKIRTIADKGAGGIVVVQDSFYKDLRIPLSDIIVEMMMKVGFQARIVNKDIVKSHMKHLDPRQFLLVKNKTLREDAIFFTC